MKSLLFILITLSSISTFGQKKEFVSEEFKFKMMHAESTVFETKKKGKWGGMVGTNSVAKAEFAAFAYKGKVSDEEIKKFAVQESGIEAKYWEAYDDGKNSNGFEWWEMYKVEKNGKTLFGIVGKNKHHNIYYIMFVMVPDESVHLYEKDLMEWVNSCEGLE